jgi:hypothetical protein
MITSSVQLRPDVAGFGNELVIMAGGAGVSRA